MQKTRNTQILSEVPGFQLVYHKYSSGKKEFIVRVTNLWIFNSLYGKKLDKINELFKSHYHYHQKYKSWKFNTRREAEELFLVMKLKNLHEPESKHG